MPFATTKFQAGFAGPILDNLQAILERDLNVAVKSVDVNLDWVQVFDMPWQITTVFPAVYLEPDSSAIEQSDDDAYVRGTYRFVITVSIVGSDANPLKVAILKYVRAIDQAIRSATADEIAGGATDTAGRAAWEITEHRFGPLASFNTIYRRDAQLVVVVQHLER